MKMFEAVWKIFGAFEKIKNFKVYLYIYLGFLKISRNLKTYMKFLKK